MNEPNGAATRAKSGRKPTRKVATVIEATDAVPMPVVEPVSAVADASPADVAPAPAAAETPAASAPVALPTEVEAPVISEPLSAEAPVAPVPPAAVPAESPMKDTTMDTIENATAATASKTQAMFGDLNDRAKGAMERGAKLVEEMAAFNKGNMEALVESSRIAARGFESLGQDAAAFTKQAFEQSTAAMRQLATVKSPTEFMKLQGDLMRQSFDQMVGQGSRQTETMLKLAGEVAQPISNRFAVAIEKAKVAA